VLGRIVEALTEQAQPYNSKLYSLVGNIKMVEGPVPASFIDQRNGVVQLREYEELTKAAGGSANPVADIINEQSESMFAETYSHVLETSLRQTEELGDILADVTLTEDFVTANTGIMRQFDKVAKLIHLREELGTNRDVFIVSQGGFDTHNSFTDANDKLAEIDQALDKFSKEMGHINVWNDVAILTVSDFGRTMTSNGQGTDHAWGGNHILIGGAVKGGKIHGKFPESLSEDSAEDIGRGRVIPTSSWESIWRPLADWFGVEEGQMDKVLPNVKNFPEDVLYQTADVFN